jgi:hypothetical protein
VERDLPGGHGRYGHGIRGSAPDAPRNVTWAKKGKWVHPAKIALEEYFLMKMKRGVSEPFFEKTILDAIGIGKREVGG